MLEIVEMILRLAAVVLLAVAAGKAAAKLKMPAVLGFLIAGMALGPHGLGLLKQEILDDSVYHTLISFLECGMGLMLGSEMVWRRMRSYGKQIVVITLAQSLMTFLVVSAAFSAIFFFMDIPVFLGLIFGGIALATAPAPALSIVTEYKTEGPVTRTLIPQAVIDDVIAICVFLSVMGVILQKTAGGSLPGYLPVLVVLFPVLIGAVTGSLAAFVMKRVSSPKINTAVVFGGVVLTGSLTGSQRLLYADHSEPGGASGLSSDSGGRGLYRRLHPCPGRRKNGRGGAGGAAVPCGAHG